MLIRNLPLHLGTRVTGATTGPDDPLVLGTADYELEISVDPSGGTFSLSISVGGTPVSGSPFPVTAEQLAADQHCLIAPVIPSSGAVGTEAVGTESLWIYKPDLAPMLPSRQWYRGTTAISGANGLAYTPVTADAGQNLKRRDTVGTSYIDSNVMAVAALPSGLAAAWRSSAKATGSANSITIPGLDFGPEHPERDIVAAIAYIGIGNNPAPAVKIGGVDAVVDRQSSGNGVDAIICRARVPTGASGSILITETNTIYAAQASIYTGSNLTPFHQASSSSPASNPSMTINTPVGGLLVAAIAFQNSPNPVSWTGITGRVEVTEGSNRFVEADDLATTEQTGRVISALATGATGHRGAAVAYSKGA